MKTSKIYAVLSVVLVIAAYWLQQGASYVCWLLFRAAWWQASFNGITSTVAAVYVIAVFFAAGVLCALPGASWLAFLLPIPFLLRYFSPFALSPGVFAVCAYLAIIASSVIFSSKKNA